VTSLQFSEVTAVNSTIDTPNANRLESNPDTESQRSEKSLTLAEEAIHRAKREGLVLAVRARWIALAVIAILVPFLNQNWEVIYYIVLIGLFALIGWAHLRFGKVGQSRAELFLLFCDLALLTIITIIPNPWSAVDWPTAVQYRFDNFIYFFVFLAAGTLAYNWRTVAAIGTWTAGLWLAGMIWVILFPNAQPELTAQLSAVLGSQERLLGLLDPNRINIGLRIQEIVAFMIVAATLAVTVRRANDLVISHAAVARERANLARYFSPNVVEELSHNDDPLKQVRTQNVAVLFVDIVGFTAFANRRDPREVITTLRMFHGAMEKQVFQHHGTLDKYLGDGLMATFGTPFTGPTDASNAMKCSYAMIKAVIELNRQRSASGQPIIKASFGLHYGSAVLGDIGSSRLEFAVIGDTVNVASRLESMSRSLECTLVASDDIIQQAQSEGMPPADLQDLVPRHAQTIRSVEQTMTLWTRTDSHMSAL
jgi:class 3 adenylate cyclase